MVLNRHDETHVIAKSHQWRICIKVTSTRVPKLFMQARQGRIIWVAELTDVGVYAF